MSVGSTFPTSADWEEEVGGGEVEAVEDDRRERGDVGAELGCFLAQDLDWGLHGEALVGPAEVVVQDVPEEAFQHLVLGGQRFEGVELVLDAAVEVLDHAVEAGRPHGDGEMAGAIALLDEPGEGGRALGPHGADELGAVVGLHSSLADVDAVAEEMREEQVEEAEGVELGSLVGQADVDEAGGDVLGSVLIGGKAFGLDRRQERGEIVEVLGIDLELLEGAHGVPDLRGQAAATPALGAAADEAVGVQDAVDGGGGAMQPAPLEERLDLVLAQARISPAQADHLVLDGGRSLVGWGMPVLAPVDQRVPPALLVAADPQADGLAITAEGAGAQGEVTTGQVVLDEAQADPLGMAGIGNAVSVAFRWHLRPPARQGRRCHTAGGTPPSC